MAQDEDSDAKVIADAIVAAQEFDAKPGVDPMLQKIGKAIGLTDEEIAEEVRKMLDGDNRPKTPSHLPPAEGFAMVTQPEALAKGLKQKGMLGYAIVLVNEDFQSVIALNVAHGFPTPVRSQVMDATVTALELAKLRILMGSV